MLYISQLIKMRSQLIAQFMPFFRLIAHILTFRDKKYRILTFCDKKWGIFTFRDKTESYFSLWLTLALSGSLRLSQALSGSLRLSQALYGSLLLSEFAYKALARLVAALLRYSTLISPGILHPHIILISTSYRQKSRFVQIKKGGNAFIITESSSHHDVISYVDKRIWNTAALNECIRIFVDILLQNRSQRRQNWLEKSRWLSFVEQIGSFSLKQRLVERVSFFPQVDTLSQYGVDTTLLKHRWK